MADLPSALSAPRLIDVRAVAAKLDCDPRTVYRFAAAGRIPFGVKLGALRKWSEAELDAWIAAGCKATAQAAEVRP